MTNSKSHILKTSFYLFLQKSFKEVTMNEIVVATGLSKGAFYHYFQSKEQLFVEVINTFFFDQLMIDYRKLNTNSLWDFYHAYAEQLKIRVSVFTEYLNGNDTKASVNSLIMMFDAMNLFPGFRDKLMEAQQDELHAWTSIVAASRSQGEFESPMSDEQIARMFIYSNDGIALYLLLNGNMDTVDRELITLWDNFYRELRD
jgi:TetR/AcrR family transcriptional regulator, transcriptional repressor for nem operon